MEVFIADQCHVVGLALVATVLVLVYRALNSPLAKIPGPWYSKWTSAVILYKQSKGEAPQYVHDLHRKYGPVVRISPTETALQDVGSMQTEYKIGKSEFHKSDFYTTLLAPGIVNVFNATEPEVHRRYRRLLSAGVSETGLVVHRPVVDKKVRMALQRMAAEQEVRGVTDVFHWFLCMATDVVGELSFGESFRMLESGKRNQYLEDLNGVAADSGGIRALTPEWFSNFLVKLPIPAFRRIRMQAMRLQEYSKQSLQRHYDIVERQGESAKPTLLSKLYKAGEEGLSFKEVQNNASSYIVAGSDTTANTLTYLVWNTCSRPEVKAKLVKELSTLPNDFNYDHLKNLHYLNHVVDETLRLYSAVPAGLPRVVPPEGANMGGYFVPGGSIVSTQAYGMHRIEEIFPDALQWTPERWESPTQAMKDAFVPWGGGSRTCIGLHLARMELRLASARFFLTFPNARVSSKEGFCDDDMQPQLFFLSGPKNHRCLIEVS